MDKRADKRADRRADRGEVTALMEPLLLSSESADRGELADLSLELGLASAGFSRSLPDRIMKALAELVRAMNCYYSNLIEGHNTHPIDIERALKEDYSTDRTKRNLQLEAKAHISVQRWIDEGALRGRIFTTESICQVHDEFCKLLPDDLLVVEDPETGEPVKVIPGELRKRDVRVGQHDPVSPGAVPRFLERFEEVYKSIGRTEAILAVAAAHHRLLWIHPFLDGNGRVARLLSHALLLEALDTGGVWSVARGLARNEGTYKQLLVACDRGRRNDLDGRGNLSEAALATFTRFFLETCLDQVKFMESHLEPNRLRKRILLWAEGESKLGSFPSQAGAILEAVLYRGELPRGDVAGIAGSSARHARRAVSALIERGVLVTESDRSPLRLAFPMTIAERWMPGLFPESGMTR